jgi:hypothetical protein
VNSELLLEFSRHPCKPHQSRTEKERGGGFGDGKR